MRITVDFNRILDHGFVQFGEARPVVTTAEVPDKPDLLIHLDEHGLIVGLELLELSRRIGSFVDDELAACEREDLLDDSSS